MTSFSHVWFKMLIWVPLKGGPFVGFIFKIYSRALILLNPGLGCSKRVDFKKALDFIDLKKICSSVRSGKSVSDFYTISLLALHTLMSLLCMFLFCP